MGGDMGFICSTALGVVMGEVVGGNAGVRGVLRVDIDEVEG